VATFERDFDATIAYFQRCTDSTVNGSEALPCSNASIVNSGANARQALTFGSLKGAEVALYLQVQRLHAQWTDQRWWETSHSLYFDLDQTDP
jgi:hypothetical protein